MSKGTAITIGDEERHLRFDMNALAEIEERLDIELRPGAIEEDLIALAAKPMRLATTARVILWAGLIHENKELTLEEVGSWVDFQNVGDVMQGFFEQLPEMSPEAEESVRTALGTSESNEPVRETVTVSD